MIRRLFTWLRRRPRRDAAPAIAWSWLNSELLLVAGLPPADDWKAKLSGGSDTTELESTATPYRRAEHRPSSVVLVTVPAGAQPASAGVSLVLERKGRRGAVIGPADLVDGSLEIGPLIERCLAGGDQRSREALSKMLVSRSLGALDHDEAYALAAHLQLLRDALREPLGPCVVDAQVAQTVVVDALMAVDDRSFWIAGWLRDADRSATSLRAVSPEGQTVELLGQSFRHPRADVVELFAADSRQETDHGFATLAALPAPSPLDRGWMIELRARFGDGIEVPGPAVVRDRAAVLARILAEFEAERPEQARLRREHVRPALERFQRHGRRAVSIEDVRDYGTPPADPDLSVVVPLYKQIDFVEHQLAQFGHDPRFGEIELVYVLDSPELAQELQALAPHLQTLHRVPFRVVRLNRNAGFSVANNIGVSQTRGRLVLLLNSDVLPVRPGWLQRMAAFYDSTPEIGALGPKLLFEDDSIQHAGMFFEREIETGIWGNRHYFKGFHRDFPDAGISRPVPAVTGACLMIARELYESLGGLSEDYVRGGYEDSDLCVRLALEARRNWYLAEVELYHLEAQSFPSSHRRMETLYNAWLQTELWGLQIESQTWSQGDSGPPAVAAETPAESAIGPAK